MIYRFVIVSDEVDLFRRDILIDADSTFEQFATAILDSVGYNKNEIVSFVLCDESWMKRGEVSMFVDNDATLDNDVYEMADTRVGELITEERQKLIFTFDILGNRSFFIELREFVFDYNGALPCVVKSKGNAPVQYSDADALFAAPIVEATSDYLLDEEFGVDDIEEHGLDISDSF